MPANIRRGETTMLTERLQRHLTPTRLTTTISELIARVQAEYHEMPGLKLTEVQAQRLWGLDRASCDALLRALVDSKFLFRTRDGAFVRSDHIRVAS